MMTLSMVVTVPERVDGGTSSIPAGVAQQPPLLLLTAHNAIRNFPHGSLVNVLDLFFSNVMFGP
jgi:hypothetical protein